MNFLRNNQFYKKKLLIQYSGVWLDNNKSEGMWKEPFVA
jgi:hypothetical protein